MRRPTPSRSTWGSVADVGDATASEPSTVHSGGTAADLHCLPYSSAAVAVKQRTPAPLFDGAIKRGELRSVKGTLKNWGFRLVPRGHFRTHPPPQPATTRPRSMPGRCSREAQKGGSASNISETVPKPASRRCAAKPSRRARERWRPARPWQRQRAVMYGPMSQPHTVPW